MPNMNQPRRPQYPRQPTRPGQNRLLQVTKGFMNQGSAGDAGPRTRPSMYPDVTGFADTPVGRMLLKSVLARVQAGQQPPTGQQLPRR